MIANGAGWERRSSDPSTFEYRLDCADIFSPNYFCGTPGVENNTRLDTTTMADRKNKLGLSVAIGAGVGAALGVALHHLPLWLSLGCVCGIVTGIILTRMTRS